MIDLADIHPLTDFLRNHKEHLAKLKRAGRPEVLTVNGRAELVVQDAESYQRLLDLVDRAGAIAAIGEGFSDADAGRVRPAREVLASLQRKHNRRKK